MRLLSWIIMIPTALAVIVFSVANRSDTAVDFWPLPYSIELPLFSVVLSSLLVGFCVGGLIAWISGHRVRRHARNLGRQLMEAERDLTELRTRQRSSELRPNQKAETEAETRALPPASSGHA